MAEVRSQKAGRELRFRSTNQLKEVKEFKGETVIRKDEATKATNTIRELGGEVILGKKGYLMFYI